MASGKWPHTVWRSRASAQTVGNPLEPGGVHGGFEANSVTATSASGLTAVTTRYFVQLTLWGQPDAAGNLLVGLEDAGLLAPNLMVVTEASSAGPYPNPWPGGQSSVDFTASDGLEMSYGPVQSKVSTGLPSYAITWTARGETHGMRHVAGPVTAGTYLLLGWNYNSFLANYVPQNPGIGWTLSSFLRTLWGSQTSIT